MSTAVESGIRGSIKVGRWVYPAVRLESGTVARNTKRDGDGDWVDVPAKDADKFVAESGAEPEPEAKPKSKAKTDEVPTIDGFTEGGHSDYDDLRIAYTRIFDDFAVTYDEVADTLGSELGRAKTVVSKLIEVGLVVTDRREAQGKDVPAETIIQSLETYDHITRDQALGNFAAALNPGVKLRRSSGHGGKVGAQHKKPGKSTWAVGSKCPQGHKLTEGDIYVMPSGRKQCKKCRAGYPSNV